MTEWRNHPALKGKFHPEYPDDIQVIVHDGGPRLTHRRPELIWVRVIGGTDPLFTGVILNQPDQLKSVHQDQPIKFIALNPYPLMVTDKYLEERKDWIIHPCDRCGLPELFDAPSDLMRAVFPNMPQGAQSDAFTAFCGACGGILIVQSIHAELEDDCDLVSEPPKKWWQFWKE